MMDLLQLAVAKPVRVPVGFAIQVAGKDLHISHDIWVYKHLYFCRQCGRVAGWRVVQLGGACEPIPLSTTGARNLRRLSE